MPVLPLTVSPDRTRLPSSVTVGAPAQFVWHLRVTPDTVTSAPGLTVSSPRPASTLVGRALGPSIVTPAVTVSTPG